MIFCTVGMEQYPFDRLVMAMDAIASRGGEDVFIQSGASTYTPKNCKWEKYISFEEMKSRVEKSRITVGHAGAGTYLLCRSMGKVPVLVPRRKELAEHVSDHQIDFCRKMEVLNKAAIVYDDKNLAEFIENYHDTVKRLNPENNGEPHLLAEYLHQIIK